MSRTSFYKAVGVVLGLAVCVGHGYAQSTDALIDKLVDKGILTVKEANDLREETEKNFKEAALILITKLEEFRDLNGDVWEKYRNEMTKAVTIVKETSTRLGEDLENINAEFYERLNETLQNLDQCIQRFVPTNRR